MKIYLSKRSKSIGGGSNTFSWLFRKWAKQNGHKICWKIEKSDLAILIAHYGKEDEIRKAKNKASYIIHRLDEYFEPNEDDARRRKHEKIIKLNRLADCTIFQSRFVFDNVYPYIKPKNFRIIHNGADPNQFYAAKNIGSYIGHVTWGIDKKKRLDILHEFISKHHDEKFLLVGRHKKSSINFELPNVRYVGEVNHKKMPKYFRKMKMLFFPSENDPCPNTVIEAILSGVPVCYNPNGGVEELIKFNLNEETRQKRYQNRLNISENDAICGMPLDFADEMIGKIKLLRENCLKRTDLYFDRVFEKYMNIVP